MEVKPALPEELIAVGKRRYVNDFSYVFSQLFDVSIRKVIVEDYAVEAREKIDAISTDTTIVVCGTLQNYKYAMDKQCNKKIVWMEDFFYLLDQQDGRPFLQTDRKLVLWGLSGKCVEFISDNLEKVAFVVDSDPLKKGIHNGVKVITPEMVTDWKQYYVLIMCNKVQYVYGYLEQRGLEKGKDYDHFCKMIPSQMMSKTV